MAILDNIELIRDALKEAFARLAAATDYTDHFAVEDPNVMREAASACHEYLYTYQMLINSEERQHREVCEAAEKMNICNGNQA